MGSRECCTCVVLISFHLNCCTICLPGSGTPLYLHRKRVQILVRLGSFSWILLQDPSKVPPAERNGSPEANDQEMTHCCRTLLKKHPMFFFGWWKDEKRHVSTLETLCVTPDRTPARSHWVFSYNTNVLVDYESLRSPELHYSEEPAASRPSLLRNVGLEEGVCEEAVWNVDDKFRTRRRLCRHANRPRRLRSCISLGTGTC